MFEGAEWTTEQEPVRAGQGLHRHHDVQQAGLLHLDADEPRRSAGRPRARRPHLPHRPGRPARRRAARSSPRSPPRSARRCRSSRSRTSAAPAASPGRWPRRSLVPRATSSSSWTTTCASSPSPSAARSSSAATRPTPTIVGAHMFDLLDRPKLHAWAEVVDDEPFMWRALYQEKLPHDFSAANLRQTPMLHMRLDADYNGWWMCLIPIEVIREVGLALPAFIKWDDAEFCLRARDAGYPTVSVPGVALWHVSWVGKDDSIDWQAYFHARNRIVAGLLHSTHAARRHAAAPQSAGGSEAPHDDAVLPGRAAPPRAARHPVRPGAHAANLATAMPAARALAQPISPRRIVHKDTGVPLRSRRGRAVFKRRPRTSSTTRRACDCAGSPPSRSSRTGSTRRGPRTWPSPRSNSARTTRTGGACRCTTARSSAPPTAPGRTSTPAIGPVPPHAASTACGCTGALRREWPSLSRRYRAAQPELTSLDAWQHTFGESS